MTSESSQMPPGGIDPVRRAAVEEFCRIMAERHPGTRWREVRPPEPQAPRKAER